MYKVLLFYKINKVKDPTREVLLQKEVCTALQLKGRILIDERGINGTVGGSESDIKRYKQYMNKHRLFKDIDFKESESEFNPFPRLRVRVREEMISTHAKEDINLGQTGRYINRDTFHEWLQKGEDMVIIDMRNDYEWEVGRFKDAIKPPVKRFFELKDNMDFYHQFKDKKVVMYCTGGIRCIPASAYFVAQGFDPKNVFQLEGGIVKYAEKYGDEGFFEGKCFVFDDRVTIPVDTTDKAVVVGQCFHCVQPSDEYRNCMYKNCNRLHLSCNTCWEKSGNACSDECHDYIKDDSNKRPTHHKELRRISVNN